MPSGTPTVGSVLGSTHLVVKVSQLSQPHSLPSIVAASSK